MRTVLITGASNGIGRELAYIFAENSFRLLLVARSEDKLRELAQELRAKYEVEALVFVQDLASENGAKELVQALREANLQVDYLVNNAGFGKVGAFLEEDEMAIREMINLNVRTLTELSYLLLPEMKARNFGGVLNIASTAAFQSLPNFAVYAGTKAYVLSFTEALHYELRDTKLSVTALCPGPTTTGFAKRANAEEMTMFKTAMGSPEVARLGYEALMQGRMYVIAGLKNKLLAWATRLVPSRRLLIRLVAKVMR